VTRELKLALIVGFALVLGVTVLISDHLSQARRSDLDSNVVEPPQLTPAAAEPAAAVPIAHDPAPSGRLVGGPQPAPQPEPVTILTMRTPGVTPDPAAGVDPALVSAVRGLGGEVMGSTIYPPPLVGGPSPGAGGAPGNARPDPNVLSPDRPVGQRVGVQIPEQAPALVPDRPPLGPGQPPLVAPTPVTPATTDYVVKGGDTAYQLAKRFYGSGEAWRQLAQANPGRVGPQGQLRQGVTLKVPARVQPGRDAAAPQRNQSQAAPASAVATRTYTVKRGDTLGEIAQRELKSARRSAEILRLNAGVIHDADDLRTGTVLKLPV
jgi:nucleoid-associated protein YgaU